MDIAVITPPGFTFESLFNESNSFFKQGLAKGNFYCVKEEIKKLGYNFIPVSKATSETNIFFHYFALQTNIIKKWETATHIYFACEPHIVENTHTMKNLIKLSRNLYNSVVTTLLDAKDEFVLPITYPINFDVAFEANTKFKDKKLAVIFSGNKYSIDKNELYSKRREIIKYFEKNHSTEFDFYGSGWSQTYRKFKTYKGFASCKLTVGSEYKFSFCLTNEKHTSLCIDEKIFEAMFAGCVPILWPIDSIYELIPKDCYINFTKFNTMRECYEYLNGISEAQYEGYINRIKLYLHSSKIHALEPMMFAKKLVQAIKIGQSNKLVRNYAYANVLRFKRKIYCKTNSLVRKISLLL